MGVWQGRGEQLVAPQLIDLEVVSAWRRLLAAGHLDERRAELPLKDLAALRLERTPHGPLVDRCWELRNNLTVYDAAHVSLAELFGVCLLTGDGRLASAHGVQCKVETI